MALFPITAVFFSKSGFGEEKAVRLSLPHSDPEAPPALPAASAGTGDRQHQHRGLGASLPGQTPQEVGAWLLPGDLGRGLEAEQSPVCPTRHGAPTLLPAPSPLLHPHKPGVHLLPIGTGVLQLPILPPIEPGSCLVEQLSARTGGSPFAPEQGGEGDFLGRGCVTDKLVPCCMA